MRRALRAAVCVALLCGARAGAAEPAKTDEARLQGTWIGREAPELGKLVPPPVFFTIRGSRAEFKESKPENTYKGTLTLNPLARPKELDFAIAESTNPKFKGKTSLGIYKLNKDGTWTLAANEPGLPARPKEFKATGSVRVFVFKEVVPIGPAPKGIAP